MIFCRLLTFVFLLAFTACGLCSCLFPLYRRKITVGLLVNASTSPVPRFMDQRETVYYWYRENMTQVGDTHNYERLYNDARLCEADKAMFVVASALSTAGTALGGIATMMASAWVYAGYDSCLHSFLIFITFISFACYTVTVVMVAVPYTTDSCKGGLKKAKALRDYNPKYEIVEGFILACIAAGGMLFAVLLAALNFFCCTDEDDYRGDRMNNAQRSAQANPLKRTDSMIVVLPGESLPRTSSSLSRSRGEVSMSRRSSSANLTRTGSSLSSRSGHSSASSRSSASGHSSRSHSSAASGYSSHSHRSASSRSGHSSSSSHRRPLPR